MAKSRAAGARILACFILLVAGLVVTPADARLMDITITSSGLALYGIPLPDGAEPTLAANMPLEGLQAMAPGVPDLGKGQLRAVVYELQAAAPPDAVADFYQRELGRRLELAARTDVERGKTRDDGIRVLYFHDNGSYLAIHAEDLSRPSRITVILVQGVARPVTVLQAVDILRTGEGPQPSQPPPLLAPPHWEVEAHFEGAQLNLFKRLAERGDTPGPVADVRRALLRRARSLNLQDYRLSRLVPAPEILAAFHQEARRRTWRLVSVDALSVDAQGGQEVVALYRFPNDTGMVMLRAGRPDPDPLGPRAPAASTEITRLEVAGPINFAELFRPITLRRPSVAVPTVAIPLPSHGRSSAPPRR